jgi:carbon-monoxide dehydrogenase medium subunit
MKAPHFEYEKPATLADALRLLAEGGENAKVLAGGQSLGPLLNLRMARPDLLVDIRTLPELHVCEDDADGVTLGAAVTHAAIEDGQVPDPTHGLLARVAQGIAYRAVRNRGTLGGSLAHADPAADWVTTMVLLDAELRVAGADGERVLRAEDLVDGPLSTCLAPDEIIVSVRLPRLSADARWSYYKFNRKPGEFAEAIAAVVHDPARGVVRAVLGAMEGAPHVIPDPDALLTGDIDALAADIVTHAGFAPDTYEHRVHAVALRRAVAGLA